MNRTALFDQKFWCWKLALLILTIFIPAQSRGQVFKSTVFTVTINDVSLIRINPYAIINMSLLASAAGETMAPKTNNSSYLQLTSIVPPNITRRVMAVISSGFLPSGTMMTLSAGTSTGVGNFGDPAPTIILERGANYPIINNIKSGYTGTGFNLTYTWQVDPNTISLLRAVLSVPIIVTYTITNN